MDAREPSFPLTALTLATATTALSLISMVMLLAHFGERIESDLILQSSLQRVHGEIVYMDEILTMSTIVASATGELGWEDRYKSHEPLLKRAIAEAQQLLPESRLSGIHLTDKANLRLVEYERTAFDLIRSGDLDLARSLLESPAYVANKQRYKAGLSDLISQLDDLRFNSSQKWSVRARIVEAACAGSGLLLMVVWTVVVHSIRKWRLALTTARSELQTAHTSLILANERLSLEIDTHTKLVEIQSRELRELARELTEVEQLQRQQFAQMLHDDLQQILVACRLLLQNDLHDYPKAQRFQRLIEEALQASRAVSLDLAPPVLQECDLVLFLTWLSQWMGLTHNLSVKTSFPQNLGPISNELQLIIFQSTKELLFNVVKHARVLEARLSVESDNKGMLYISVTDSGAGFSEKYTEDRSKFGLSGIRRRLSLVGGSFSIYSDSYSGTSAQITVPIDENNPEPISLNNIFTSEPIASPFSLSAPRARILVVEDHDDVRAALVERLRTAGFSVVGEASDQFLAITLAEKLAPDVAIVDVSLKNDAFGGISLTKELRTRFSMLRVIAWSSHNDSNIKNRMLEAGAFCFVHKSEPLDCILDILNYI